MKSINLTIRNKQGLHARPSTKFAQIAEEFSGNITVKTKDNEVSGKNVMELMLLALDYNEKFTVIADANDEKEEEQILSKLQHLVEVQKFYET